jgi:integrase/recombinase XerD
MTTISPTTDVVYVEPLFTDAERIALAGFLAGSGLTRDAYALDLRQYASWCQGQGLHLFEALRANIECFGRDMEARGRARATIARRLCTVSGFYRYAVEEELLEHSPAVHVRRPRLDYESHAIGLDRNEVGALLVAAGLGAANEHALISLLAINALRISEALGADIDALGIERGHRTLTVLRKGGKIVTLPLAPRTARTVDLAIGERLDGPIFLRPDEQRMDRHCASRIVRRVARRAGVNNPSGRTRCAKRSSPQPSTPASRFATSRRLRPTRIRARPCATTALASPSTATPPTSSPPTSPAPPANPHAGPRARSSPMRAPANACGPGTRPPKRSGASTPNRAVELSESPPRYAAMRIELADPPKARRAQDSALRSRYGRVGQYRCCCLRRSSWGR